MVENKSSGENRSITLKMLRVDLLRKKTITLLLVFFITIASFLVASSASMIVELMSSLNYLFARSNVPHFVQMNTGKVNSVDIEKWAAKNTLVKDKQIVEMLQLDQSKVFVNKQGGSLKNSIMNIDFVTQNPSFDYLFNLKGQVVHPAPGEVAVPVYFMQRFHLNIGDKIKIQMKNDKKEFVIVDFIRDALMNPSIIHSKRFLISPEDFKELKKGEYQPVYLIEFQLNDLNQLNKFGNDYIASALPKSGPVIHYQLYQLINAINDGFTIGLLTLVSILLTIVAMLSLRFTMLTTMEEDFRQIGIMKAIGIQQNYIKGIYLAKYLVIAIFACAMGYLLALFFKQAFISNILLYLGSAPKDFLLTLIPLLSVSLIFLTVLFSSTIVLRKFTRISAVEALRAGIAERLKKSRRYLSLKKNNYLNVNVFLGVKDVLEHWKKFFLLFFVFFICSFILILPVNFFNTIKSSGFMTLIGIGKSEMRIDMQQDNVNEFNKILAAIKQDKTVKKYSAVIASRFQVQNGANQIENINIESGDSSLFPIHYLQGRAPSNENEIALSYLNSKELNTKTGDHLHLILNGKTRDMLVSGVYQDITNGGRTAKSLLPYNPNTILWYVFNVNFKANVALDSKIDTYAKHFPKARVTNVKDYLAQTLGDLITQIKTLAIIMVCVTIFIAIIISSLFLKLLVARHFSQIAIMKALGFSLKDIRIQYLTRSLFVLIIGILVGSVLSNTIGEWLTGLVWSLMGAPEIKFIIIPLQTYILCPLLLMGVVSMTTMASVGLIKQDHIEKMIVE